jgi:hypothetical protein
MKKAAPFHPSTFHLPIFMDPYDLLGLLPDATSDQIRVAYRRLATEWHPDHQPPEQRAEAVERMVQLNAARDLLLDARRRVEYHRIHEDALRWKVARAQGQANQSSRPPETGPKSNVSWAFREERERQARRRFYGRLAVSLLFLLVVLTLMLPNLLAWASGSSPELRAAANMMEASVNTWLVLIGSIVGTLFFAVVLALLAAGLGHLLKR